MDTQVVEILGRQRLIGELLRDGLEVALPVRDRGIDLIAYAELNSQVSRFAARPIQMKASTATAFGVDRKYERFADLILAYVWNLGVSKEAATYAMTYSEAKSIADVQGMTSTGSWTNFGAYSTRKPSKQLLARMEPHRMTPGKWWRLVTNDMTRTTTSGVDA